MYRGGEACLLSATDFGEELVGKFPLVYEERVSPSFCDGLELIFI